MTTLEKLSHSKNEMMSKFLCIFLFMGWVQSHEVYTEELLIKTLPSGHVYSQFSFTTALHNPPNPMDFYRLFPMTIGEILQSSNVNEFHFSLTQGKWSHDQWGYPVKDRPAGAVLWAWFRRDADRNWKKFASALGGVTCSSLNFIDESLTVVPKYNFRPDGHIDHLNVTNLRVAMLPGEAVCTENLTPWMKLLPCSKTGLTQLLRATSLFTSHYFSIGMDVKRTCIDRGCLQTQLLLQQHIAVVTDTTTATGRQDWSFLKLFGKTIQSVCPLATKTSILVDTTPNGVSTPMKLSPEPNRVLTTKDSTFAVYDVREKLRDSSQLSLSARFSKTHLFQTIKSPPLTVNRYLQGYGLEQGGIRTVIVNSRNIALNVTYLEIIPWYLRVYVHTLNITSNGIRVFPKKIVFQPALDRERPCHLEIGLALAPMSTTEIFFSFERAFLTWTEYPPDPHLGFYIPAASLEISLPPTGFGNLTADLSMFETIEHSLTQDENGKRKLLLFTEILLVTLPTPDFSMPYNVICFVCTALALAFGPIHNITTKNLILRDKTLQKSLLQRILQKLKGVSNKKSKKD